MLAFDTPVAQLLGAIDKQRTGKNLGGPGGSPGVEQSYFPLSENLYHRSVRAFAHGAGPRSDHGARINLITNVLDFVHLGGPDLTLGSTIFEMRISL